MNCIYLDHAAATPLNPDVFAAMQPYFSDQFYNPSAQYLSAKTVAKDVQTARAQVAKLLGCRPGEIVFTAGGTEADNLAIQGVMRKFPGANLIVSAIEHDAILAPASEYNHKIVPVKIDGLIDLNKLEKLIDDQTVLISIMYANNEIGTIEPIRQVSQTVEAIRRQRQREGNELPLYLHTDACQAANYLDLHVSRLGVDLMTLNGGKIYGPKQSGALYIRTGVVIEPLIYGGGQERKLRSGTENVPAIVGFAKALELAQSMRTKEQKRLEKLQKLFLELLEKKIPQAVVNGSLKHRLQNNIHITIPRQDNERLMMLLDEKGIQCAVGSACSASNDDPSHVLKAINLSDEDARASLRFTMGRSTSETDIRFVVDNLAKIV